MPESNLESTTVSSANLQPTAQPDLVDIPTIRLLEERLNVKINQRKVGEVVVRKVVETEVVEIPIRREKLVIEQVGPEHKQLASVDLGTGVNREELAALVGDQTSDATVGSSMAGPSIAGPSIAGPSVAIDEQFLSIEVAHQLLSAILNQPAYQNSKVKLVFESEPLRTAYQRWLERYIVR